MGCHTCLLNYFTLVCLLCGRTDRRAYGHVITKISRMGRLLHFLGHRATLGRAWSSAINSDTHTCIVPLAFRGFVLVWTFFNAILRVGFFFSSLYYFYKVSSKRFSTSSLAQSRIMAKTFCKLETASIS